MNTDTPISVVVAGYDSPDGATRDFTAVWGARAVGAFHHTSVAVLTRARDGELQVAMKETTAADLMWGGALMRGALLVLAPAAGVTMPATDGLAGVGAMMGHIRSTADPATMAAIRRQLDGSRTSLVVVAVNRVGADIAALLEWPSRTSSVDLVWGDLEDKLSQDFMQPLSEAALVATYRPGPDLTHVRAAARTA